MTLVQWFAYVHPKIRIIAIPNGAFLFGDINRRAAQMARLKKAGLSPGVPDLMIPAWGPSRSIVWIELKRRTGGRVSDEQESWHQYLRSIGHTVIVASGADSAIRQLEKLK